METLTTEKQIKALEDRKEAANWQRKITTSLATAITYDMEIDTIDAKLAKLRTLVDKLPK